MKALAVTATLVVLLLGLGIAILWVLPSPEPGEQSVIVDVVPEGQEGVSPAGQDGATPQGQEGAPAGGAPAGSQTAPQNDERSDLQIPDVPEENLSGLSVAGGRSGDPEGSALPPVPVDSLLEQSEYGPLPKVGEDGQTPADAYAARTPPAAAGERPRVAILMDGLGEADVITHVLLRLPPQISIALGPYGRGLQDWVAKARDKGHEVFLQVPLEPPDYPNNDPGPHTLLTNVDEAENRSRLHWLMSRFTGYVGLTNYSGSKFQSAEQVMRPFLAELKDRGLLYVSDGAAEDPTPSRIAQSIDLDFASAVVQIEDQQQPERIEAALNELEAAARERGTAIGVAEAGPETVQQIVRWASVLDQKGISLVPVSAAVSARS